MQNLNFLWVGGAITQVLSLIGVGEYLPTDFGNQINVAIGAASALVLAFTQWRKNKK